MDKFNVRRMLMEELGRDAKSRMMAKTKKKYDTGNPTLDAVAESQDEAVESARMPSTKLGDSMDKWDEENKAALAEFEEDEEDAKWLAKQKG